MTGAAPPPPNVIEAFGGKGEPVLLSGGRGVTWQAGEIVLKHSELAAESRWRASVLERLRTTDAFDVARPVRATGGDWLSDGWEAWHWVPGEPDHQRPDDVIAAGRAFHAAIVGEPRPQFLDQREDPWSVGDRAAWGEAEQVPNDPLLQALFSAQATVTTPSQLVHGDLLGNVIFAPGLAPTVIDWPPYWRPASWGAAIAAVDALCWYGAAPGLLDRWAHLPMWEQMLLRALVYRITTDYVAADRPKSWRSHRAYQPVAELVLARSS